MRHLLALLLLLCCVAPAQAQLLPATQPAEAAAPSFSVDDLINIIENDTTRAELIERLRNAAPAGNAAAPSVPPDPSIARQLAEYTRSVAEGASSTLRALGGVVASFQQVFAGGISADAVALQALAINMGIVIIGLFGSYFLLRLVTTALERRLAADAVGRSIPRRVGGLALVALIDIAAIVIAWALGYALALNTGTTPDGHMGINQSLLLNAFLIVEACKLVFRIVLVPYRTALRLLPITDDNAAYWSFWADRMVSLLGYTFLFVTPMLNVMVSPAAGAVAQVLVMATAVTIGIIIVLQNKDDVRTWLAGISERRGDDGLGRLLIVIGQHWHVLAISYLVTLLVAWFVNPSGALPFMLRATAETLVAILVGSLVASFIGRFVSAGISLPDDVRQRLPLLETRLRAFVPGVMNVVRWVVVAGVLVSIGQAWALFDFAGWIGSDEGLAVAGAAVSATLIVLAAIALHVVVASWVEYRLNTKAGKMPTPREKTLLNLFKNAFTIALVVFGLMLALAQIGVNIAPLLAGAGVVGLAIGFGAQKLVQDIITGIFIQFENVMNEGDVVEVAGKSGVVEKLTIRSVTIRDLGGTVHLIPFSSVDQVSNMMRGFSFHVAEIGVAYDSDIDQVKAALHEAFDLLMQTGHKDEILDDLDMQGIIGFGDSAVTVRARIKTLPGKHWAIGRKYSELVKAVFYQRSIEIPYPHVTYVQGGEARGSGRSLPRSRPRKAEPGAG